MVKYFLMHKDHVCGTIAYDETTGRIINYHDNKTGYSPFLGNSDAARIKKWWEMRAIPASRASVENLLREAGCFNPGSYLAKNLALSMTDAYWICPENANVTYDEVKLSNFALYHDGKLPYHNATSYDPNASLGGQMEKYWDLGQDVPVLVKKSYKHFGQQSINEVFATRIHDMQDTKIPYVVYSASITEDRGILCKCNAFTSEHIEFIPAYEVVESKKTENSMALYDSYIDICEKAGIDRGAIQDFMDYQTLTDFIISNTDEHLLNFGILRDADSMKVIGPAPIFDSGNSMFYSDERKIPYTRAGILERKVTSFYNKEEFLLKKIQNKNIVKLDLLPSPEDTKRIYENAGIPEWKAEVISKNYEIKLKLAEEFQKGKTVSLYHEQLKEKNESKNQAGDTGNSQKFIMLCGIPGSGKSKYALECKDEYLKRGYAEVNPQNLYSIDKILNNTDIVIDNQAILSKIQPLAGLHRSVAVISSNDIRQELKEQNIPYDKDLVFTVAGARMKAALLSGTTVIYDAINLEKADREYYIGLAEEAGVKNRELHVMNMEPENSSADIPLEKLFVMDKCLKKNLPDYNEGWTVIINHGLALQFAGVGRGLGAENE